MTEYSLIIKLDPSQATNGMKSYKREVLEAKVVTESLGKDGLSAGSQIVAGMTKATAAVQSYGATAQVSGEKEAAAAHKAMLAREVASNKIVSMDRYRKIQLGYQLNDIGVSLAGGMNPLLVMAQQGTQISQIYAGQGGAKQAITDTIKAVGGLATKVPLLTAGLAALGIATIGMKNSINEASGVTVSFGDVALGIFQTIGQGIYSLIQPAVKAMAPWFSAAWSSIISFTNSFVNDLVLLVVGSFEVIKTAILSVPDAFIVAGQAAANGFMVGIEWMVNTAIAVVSNLANSIMGMLPDAVRAGSDYAGAAGFKSKSAPQIKLPRIEIGAASSAKNLVKEWEDADKRITKIANTDYAGKFYENVKKNSVANAIERAEDERSAGSKRKKANETDKLSKALENLRNNMSGEIDALKMEQQALGMNDLEATKLRKSFEWLRAAKQAGLAITPQLIGEINKEAEAYAKLSVEVENAASKKQQLESFAQGIGSAFGTMITGLGSKFKNMKEYLKNFGMQLLDLVVDIFVIQPMIESLKSSISGVGSLGNSSGSGGGFLSTALSWIGNIFGFKDGGEVKSPVRLTAGGPVWGAGTSTSDSIDAKLSDGEYVINARQTSKHRSLIEAINSGSIDNGEIFLAGGGYASGQKTYERPVANVANIQTFRKSEERKVTNEKAAPATGTNSSDAILINVIGARGNQEIQQMVAIGVKQAIKKENRKAAINHVNSTKEASKRGYR